MKLYYSTQTCSTACHIAMEEAGLKYTPVEVSWKRNVNVTELSAVNPLGSVPALVSDQGKVLTQNAAILEYIGDLSPTSNLLAKPGTWERYETMSWVSFVASDLHKAFSPFFRLKDMTTSETAQQEIKKFVAKNVMNYLDHVDKNLAGKTFITGSTFTIADAYLYVIAGWAQFVDIDVSTYKNLGGYMNRVGTRPAVQKVMNVA